MFTDIFQNNTRTTTERATIQRKTLMRSSQPYILLYSKTEAPHTPFSFRSWLKRACLEKLFAFFEHTFVYDNVYFPSIC